MDRSRAPKNKRPGIAPRKQAEHELPDLSYAQESRQECSWCGSFETTFYKRGLTGPTDDRDQYFMCQDCGRRTYEIISRTNRDMRVGQYRVGGQFRDTGHQAKYMINRVLKVGMNEYLLYVKPILNRRDDER